MREAVFAEAEDLLYFTQVRHDFHKSGQKRAGTIFRARPCSDTKRKARQEQHKLSLRTVLYSFGLLWFLSGLLALQSALINANDPASLNYQAAVVLQERQTVQTSDPSGRTQNGTLSAPVRAILTPALYFSSKALPFSGNGTFIIPALFTLLAAFTALFVARLRNNPAKQACRHIVRARAPPLSTYR